MSVLTRRAWKASLGMVIGALVGGAVIVGVAPIVSAAVSGPGIPLDRLAVAGWVLYVAASGTLQPFASLAAARGRPSQVLRCRLVDAVVVVTAIPLLLGLGVSVSWTPFILAAGLVLGGILVRQLCPQAVVRVPATPIGGVHAIKDCSCQPLAVLGLSPSSSVWRPLVATAGPASLPAEADPIVSPETVTADVLPTWQINGVVWSQVVVGNTVYVTGSFTKARPPGVPVGGAGEVDADNIFAFDITTGNRVPFDHSLNASGPGDPRQPHWHPALRRR